MKSSLQGNEEGLTADIAKSSKEGTSENAKMFDFWGVANALADSVKKTTADISARCLYLSSTTASNSYCQAACRILLKGVQALC